MRLSVLSFCILISMTACVSGLKTEGIGKSLPRNALSGQVLRFRLGHEGKLTNQVCTSYQAGRCVRDVAEYNLSDAETRATLVALKFRCDVGGRRFRICADKPGLCRRNDDVVKRVLFFTVKRTPQYEFLDATKDFKFLAGAKTRCEVFKGEQ